MNLMRRFGLVALLAVGVALFASTQASGEDWGTIQLANVGAEPGATGEASLTKVRYMVADGDDWYWMYYYSGTLSVKCQNLTPGATYWTPAGTFTANRKGAGSIRGYVPVVIGVREDGWSGPTVTKPYVIDVVRLEADGSSTPVLTGTFVPPWANE